MEKFLDWVINLLSEKKSQHKVNESPAKSNKIRKDNKY